MSRNLSYVMKGDLWVKDGSQGMRLISLSSRIIHSPPPPLRGETEVKPRWEGSGEKRSTREVSGWSEAGWGCWSLSISFTPVTSWHYQQPHPTSLAHFIHSGRDERSEDRPEWGKTVRWSMWSVGSCVESSHCLPPAFPTVTPIRRKRRVEAAKGRKTWVTSGLPHSLRVWPFTLRAHFPLREWWMSGEISEPGERSLLTGSLFTSKDTTVRPRCNRAVRRIGGGGRSGCKERLTFPFPFVHHQSHDLKEAAVRWV